MNALKQPISPQLETGKIPAEQAGIFLTAEFDLRMGVPVPLTEVVKIVKKLDTDGRLLGQVAAPDSLKVFYLPED